MMKQLILTTIIALSFLSFAPEGRIVSGTVTSAVDLLPMPGVNVGIKGTNVKTNTDASGRYTITVSGPRDVLIFSFIGFVTQEVHIGEKQRVDVSLKEDVRQLSEEIVVGYGHQKKLRDKTSGVRVEQYAPVPSYAPHTDGFFSQSPYTQNEEYGPINENGFLSSAQHPLSTFSIDVDAASYSNVRRYINMGIRPPADAVRIEEMINYFRYEYKQPSREHPFAIHTEIATAPWNGKHKLVKIGLQGRNVPLTDLPPSNLVFLIDVSGSMNAPNKLPLVISSLKMLAGQLRAIDKVSIVVYAGAAGLVLPPVPGNEKGKIYQALERLSAGGSTAGGAGIHLAYSVAKENMIDGGNNRVIMATDGDFNVGVSDNKSLEKLIGEKRGDGIFLTVLGYGMGNYKDSKMEILADKGNGNYAYIDNALESRKVLVDEFAGTLFTIASDVKMQIEFNPARVQAYRLIGYENRMLNKEDFNNDKKDAGELGSGHTVTALYEIIPAGVKSDFYRVDQLKYQGESAVKKGEFNDELLTVKFRYKDPGQSKSKLITVPVKDGNKDISAASENLRWSSAVAAFGMMLRQSPYSNDFTSDQIVKLARSARGTDEEGYRVEFINLVKAYSSLPPSH
jgi:Ca-activated chloride channel homolog